MTDDSLAEKDEDLARSVRFAVLDHIGQMYPDVKRAMSGSARLSIGNTIINECVVALSAARTEEREAKRPAGNGPLVHTSNEFFLGGLRFAPGTYKITRVSAEPQDDPVF